MTVRRGLAWVGAASSLVGVLDIVSTVIVLARWVTPEQLGLATLAAWLFPVLDHVTDLGLSGAVIQRDERDEDAIATVFWINAIVAAALFVVLLVAAPPIAARLTGHAVVGWMLVAYGTKLLWQNVYFIPHALMKRELRFAELSVIRVVANTAEFAGKIGFAAAGAGPWCFVLGGLCRVAVTGAGIQLRHPWRPRFVLRLARARAHLAFGLRTSASRILFQLYTNLDYPIVAHFFGAAALGAYRVAYDIVLEPVRVISDVTVAVAFPVFSRLRADRDATLAQLVAFTRLNLVAVLGYAIVVFVAASDVLAAFFPDYLDAAATIRVLCAVAVLRAISFVLPPLLEGVGHPERVFRYMLVAAVLLPACFAGFAVALPQLGYLSVAIAWAVGYPVAFAVLVWLAMRTLAWSVTAYLRRLAIPAAILTVAAGIAVATHEVFAAPLPRLVATALPVALAALLAARLRQ